MRFLSVSLHFSRAFEFPRSEFLLLSTGKFGFETFSHRRSILRRDGHAFLDVPARYVCMYVCVGGGNELLLPSPMKRLSFRIRCSSSKPNLIYPNLPQVPALHRLQLEHYRRGDEVSAGLASHELLLLLLHMQP